jgi:2-polyprenyl-6-methoxyphenol hydroxylase-like FAD-dependent oxidoreductase
MDRFWASVGGCVAIHRSALHQALRGVTAHVSVRLGVSIAGLEDSDAPHLSFSDGSSAGYDFVVGADGIRSTVRALAFGGPPARYVGQASWRFVANDFAEVTDWTAMLGRGRTFLTVARGKGAVYCYGDIDTPDPASVDGKGWRESFRDFADPVPRLLDEADQAYFAPIEEVVAPA